MSSLTIRRLIVIGVSTALGFIVSMITLYWFLPAVSPNVNEPTITITRYGLQYFFWTIFPFAMIFLTILDHFMETKIWPD